jgi:hypothetical protein
MRKSLIAPATGTDSKEEPEQEWLEIENVAKVELTSEDPNFPIEFALASRNGPGWQAATRGEQTIRIVFDKPRPLHRVRLEFSETEVERTQEFTLRWAAEPRGPLSDIVRQQWTFSPEGSTREVEDYRVNLSQVAVLELALKPDLAPGNALATLARWNVA